ncbi:MAG: GWxTD domain-containing protein [Planctomycetes bacterium]|nr:GWxTD domain-containing protein [Planctomycetota bacterium]
MTTQRNISARVFSLFYLLINLIALPGLDASDEQLSPQYRKWLDEDVVYIITPKERDVFLVLGSDRDRELFIQAFWNHRDQNKLTDRNEFKEEHERRVVYANSHFRAGSAVPGWKTDRGRIYIILGAPESIQTYEGASNLYPIISWFYQGMNRYNLPDAFYILFFKRWGVGDYKIYSPTIDGPESLLAHQSIMQSAYPSAYRELLSIDALLAKISLSPIPGESTLGETPSMSFDRLLMDILGSPQKSVQDDYAPKFLKFAGNVEVEYSANYRTSDSSVFIFRDETGVAFVHYLFELDKLAFQRLEGKWFTRLIVNVSLTDDRGRTAYQFEKNVPLEMTDDQYAAIRDQSFQFQDAFPVIDGSFQLQILAKNEASKEFTSLEKNIRVSNGSTVSLAPMAFSFRVERSLPKEQKGAFKIKDVQLYPASRNDFSNRDQLAVFTQISALPEEMQKEGSLKFSILSDDTIVREWTKKFSAYDSLDTVIEEIPLRDVPPEYYALKIAIVDAAGEEILTDKRPFIVTSATSIPRPWISTSVLPPAGSAYYPHVLGLQFLNCGQPARAEALLEGVSAGNPAQLGYALDYSRTLLAQKKFDRISVVLAPFSDQPSPEAQELLARGLHGQGDFSAALALYNEYLAKYGTNFIILNLIGDCYYRLGRFVEALQAWERSLAINAEQPEIRARAEQIKKEGR